jgi:hypothetical protein
MSPTGDEEGEEGETVPACCFSEEFYANPGNVLELLGRINLTCHFNPNPERYIKYCCHIARGCS